jgi:hypothetical protein
MDLIQFPNLEIWLIWEFGHSPYNVCKNRTSCSRFGLTAWRT